MIVVVDTNVWVSVLIGGALKGFRRHLLNADMQIVSTPPQVSELTAVLQRPKFRRYFSAADQQELRDLMRKTVTLVELRDQVCDCRDPGDNYLLACALGAKADVLMTGDEGLLVLDPYHGIRIVNYRYFEERHGTARSAGG